MSTLGERKKELKQLMINRGLPEYPMKGICSEAARCACVDEVIEYLKTNPEANDQDLLELLDRLDDAYCAAHGYQGLHEEDAALRHAHPDATREEYVAILRQHCIDIDREAHPWHYTNAGND